MTYEAIAVEEHDDGLLLVTLDRPEAANATNTVMGRELLEVFERFSLIPGAARCIVLTGRGEKAFCAGGDLKERKGMSDAQWQAQHLVFERLIRAILACPVPVIAAVNGAAFAGGCEIAAAADFIYAARHARFALTEVTLGLIPGAGGTQNLARAIGERRAKEVILTGQPFSAEEAQAWGFVNRIAEAGELLTLAMETGRRIAGNAPIAVRQAKQAVGRGIQMSIWDGLAFEIEAYNRCVPTEDRREGVLAFNEKRRPAFRGL
ncbi:enoyl-CoA hydratase [Sphingomonas histidinilytica]|uniref:Enoyl-CoA hydratase/carnithine racemase n=1 Tax=Rhizorhabdus histidinilytica TaxID=439228 RepID=A0A1T5FP32_9SPHN|nr:enoyl-CoA hydratase-related protein [Rhizorhabdus histidinilytica]MBO9377122.1 enoyl-CoA hydratase [Rhizorhabdus histidinilytica]QEH80017.1 enoyl-CoA hydratase [Sphingomonas sp. C8-2]SKB97840.1 Enoyl-CoA hydratase/carnithine racemase [Rhizorhabdus histidinilytica]